MRLTDTKLAQNIKTPANLLESPEFQAFLKAGIDKANQGISHIEFVAGIQNRTMGIKCHFGEPYHLLKGPRRTVFSILVMLYSIGPLILVPLWAYNERNCWLLFGIVVSRAATQLGAFSIIRLNDKMSSLGGWLFLACTCYCAGRFGIHNYCTFFSLCTLWGYKLFCIAEKTQNRFLIQSLLENPELFDYAVNHSKIEIISVEEENRKRRDFENFLEGP